MFSQVIEFTTERANKSLIMNIWVQEQHSNTNETLANIDLYNVSKYLVTETWVNPLFHLWLLIVGIV